ncbi:hypothetical protein [Actinokineospora bangkokensis]|uniref:ESX-1 secretion-associated protein n=1 Tax=Actinokineospora bangkokensis TaxID=1193682 RepID=A0A1Q9LQS5_9PSEU|nr:hypothetical protein [Actinokineospora bangkokensis]OLR94353.1 hypothetical protein BJP25_11340 [Actinokineospora bangkokensis]
MTTPDHIDVDISALQSYSGQLGYYQSEADGFGRLIDVADVSGEAWGVMGAFAKGQYTEKLTELRSLLEEMKSGVEALSTKISDTAATYQGTEDDAVMRFGAHEAVIDGPR